MDLQRARDWSDLVLKVFSIAAILGAGYWALYQFETADASESNIQLAVSAEILPYGKETRLLVVHVKPKNIGRVPVVIEKTSFPVIVRSIPTNEKLGPISLEKLPESFKTDLLTRFPGGYLLEPGVEYDELFAIVVSQGLYEADATLNLDAENEIDQAMVILVH